MGGIRIGSSQISPRVYIWIGIAAVIAVFSVVVYRNAQYARMDEELKESAQDLRIAVEVFAMNDKGADYPENFELVVNAGTIDIGSGGRIEIPDNPYGPGKMKLLQPGDPAKPGGFIYFNNEPYTISYHLGDTDIHIDTYHFYFYGLPERSNKRYTQVPYGVDLEGIELRLTGGF